MSHHQVNLRNLLHAGEGSMLALKPGADVTRSPKQEVSVAPQKRSDVLQFFLKKILLALSSIYFLVLTLENTTLLY